MALCGTPEDDDPPVDRGIVGLSLADERGENAVRGGPGVQQQTFIVRHKPRRTVPNQSIDVLVHFCEPALPAPSVARALFPAGYKPAPNALLAGCDRHAGG